MARKASHLARALASLAVLGALAPGTPAGTVAAQWMTPGRAADALGAPVGGDLERYIRALMVAGVVRPMPWSARPLAPRDLERVAATTSDGAHPWRGALRAGRGAAVLAPGGTLRGNSGLPWGHNDGAVWAGRGLTAALGLGATFRAGPLTMVAAPIAFATQNAPVALLDNGEPGPLAFADGQFARFIDRPQVMGDGAYGRIDPGQSQLRLDVAGLALGVGTANIGWGTSEAFAPILGANAPGFAHLFAGTAGDGTRIPGVGRVGVRYVAGVLDQSPWSPVTGSETFVRFAEPGTRRGAVGLAASWLPAFLPTLELGATRFFHSPWRAGARRWDYLGKPFDGFLKEGRPETSDFPGDPQGDLDNQLATLYARLQLPRRGAEISIEWLREDNSYDLRDFSLEPEQNSAFLAGIRVATHRAPERLGMLTLEWFDGDIAPIAQQRPQGSLYIHIPLAQGHTQRGQLLGAPMGVGAVSAQRVAWERFDSTGSWRFEAQRWRSRMRRSGDPQNLNPPALTFAGRSSEVLFDANATRLRRPARGPAHALTLGALLAHAWAFDRTRLNFYAQLSVRAW